MLFLARFTCGNFYVVYLCIFDTLYLWASGHISHVLHMNLLTCFTCCIVEILHFWALWLMEFLTSLLFANWHALIVDILSFLFIFYLRKYLHALHVNILICFTCGNLDTVHL